MKFRKFLILVLFSCICMYSCKRSASQPQEEEIVAVDTVPSVFHFGFCVDSLEAAEYQIASGDNISTIFRKLGFPPGEAETMVRSCREVLDPSKLQVGRQYLTYSTNDTLPEIRYIVFSKTLTDFAVIDLTGDTISSYLHEKEISVKRCYVEGEVTSSLWSSLKAQDVDPVLAIYLSDVYAWEIDFFDIKKGDAYQVIYDEAYIDDSIRLKIHSIQGAIFNHRKKDYVAVPFIQDGIREYFDEEGNSLRKAFLKSPLDFYRITSRFSNARFHPVLKRYRAHHGVDYAAPVGTPVKSIGDGVVIAKAYQSGSGGNYVKVKHNSVYTTTYMHLSKFASGLAVGKSVRQGEVIGYVGSSGLSTGPHLDFRVHKNGQAIDPLKMEAPPSEPVKAELRDSFLIVKQQILEEIKKLRG